MMPTENKLRVSKTARYFTLGNSSTLKQLWFVLHGYGQLASYFLKKFEVLANEGHLVVAPEGLHRFYTLGTAGRVGASWMTKEDRLSDIDDYIHYLDEVYASVLNSSPRPVQINVLGFSQGAATACRWLCHGKSRADAILLWAGLVPPDLDMAVATPVFNAARLSLVIGDEDEFINHGQVEEEEKRLKSHRIPYALTRFAGKHAIPEAVLARFAKP